jgi:saccharopine dehydrogenase-like NADP-dependent oxidoreductase
MQIVVLGAGRVGSAIAVDLAKDDAFDVRVADRDQARLAHLVERHGIPGERVDFSLSSTVARAINGADLVVSAVPGFLGYRTLEAILETGIDVVDIAFFPEDPFGLDRLAKDRDVRAIVDCGVAPGMSNLLVGYADARLDETESVAIYVGGLPCDRVPPFEYRAVFSPIDVIEEYTRPARIVVDGKMAIRPALSDHEILHFGEVGDLEAFLTDGLRTLIDTIGAPRMIEKTLRYPGHAEKVGLLRAAGFLSDEPIDVDGREVRPIDVVTTLLFPLWELREGEEDLTVMRIEVAGRANGRPTRYTYDLLDRFDPVTGTTSMARTTGYAATMAARLLADGRWMEPGIAPPEIIGRDADAVEFILAGLRDRGIVYRESVDHAAR